MENLLNREDALKLLYKKPKKNYTIGFEYKLNTRLKPVDDIFYPLYIEVRYRGKMNFFPSRITLKFSESSFNEFREEYMGQIFLKDETYRISQSIGKFFNAQNTTSISQWYAHYSKELNSSLLLPFVENLCYQKMKEVILKRANNNEHFQNTELALNIIHIHENDKSNIFELIQLLTFFGLDEFNYLYELLKLAKEVPSYIKSMPFKADTRGEMTDFITVQDIQSGAYTNALMDIQLSSNNISKTLYSAVPYYVKTVDDLWTKLRELL